MKHISWRTFRTTFSTLLKANGEDVKTVQELLRRANSRITLDIYTQAVTPAKRAAQTKVVEMIVRRPKQQEESAEEVRVPLSNPSETHAVESGVCKCLKRWRGRRDSNPRPLP
jgi:ribulose bisphosphate carboxylase small subunit